MIYPGSGNFLGTRLPRRM